MEPNPKIPAIETKNLTKIFNVQPSPIAALNGVSLKIFPGEIFVLLGRNGAGKTTLVKTLTTLLNPDSGEARIFGHDTVLSPSNVRPLISLALSEERGFYWRLTGRQNLEFFASLFNVPSGETAGKIKELENMLKLENLDRRYDQCSAGMRHKLALARCFLTDTQIIFMDEPTRSLDPSAKKILHGLIKNLVKKTGKTFFLTTHDVHEAELLADRLAVLDHGKIILEGTSEDTPASALEKIFQGLCPEETHVS